MRIPARVLPPLIPASLTAMAIDLEPPWDFGNPALSEQRFRQSLEESTGDDAKAAHYAGRARGSGK